MLLPDAVEAAQAAHVAAHGPDCGTGPGGGSAGPKSACMIVYRAWLSVERDRERERRTTLRERDAYIVTAFWAGLPLKDIAAKIDLKTARVSQVLKEHGINAREVRVQQRAATRTALPRATRDPEQRRRYRLTHATEIRAKAVEYEARPEVKARKSERMKRYRAATREQRLAYDRAYHSANRDKGNAQRRAARAARKTPES